MPFNYSWIQFEECPEDTSKCFYIKMSADSTNDDSLYPIAVLIDEVCILYSLTKLIFNDKKFLFQTYVLIDIFYSIIVKKWGRSTSIKFYQKTVNHCIGIRCWKNTVRTYSFLDRYNLRRRWGNSLHIFDTWGYHFI